jgi:TolA-binding protein
MANTSDSLKVLLGARTPSLARCLLFLLVWFGGVTTGTLFAQTAEETRLFKDAVLKWQTGFYDHAERGLAEFIQKFPNSDRVAEANLLRARALFNQQKYPAAISLISTNLTTSGAQMDQYRFWLAKAYFQNTNYLEAADAFAALLKNFPNSPKRLEASYGEAQARFKLKEWRRVIELLQNPQGAFQKAAADSSDDDVARRGQLLLGEALLEQKDFPRAIASLSRLKDQIPASELKWHREFLLCRAQIGAGHPADALENTTNMLAAAAATGQRNLVAESFALQGEILEQLDDFPAAAQAYEKNQAEGTPTEKKRQAFLKLIELALAQNNIAEAITRLESYSKQNPQDAASDLVLLTLGELRLRQHFFLLNYFPKVETTEATTPATNLIDQALGYLDKLISDFPKSPWLGKADLNRGWCFWVQEKIPESQAAFQNASEHLPFSEEQAVARFKLADAQYRQNDLTNAVQNYRLVLKDYAGLPRVKHELFDRAYFQILRASLELGQEATAAEMMRKIIDGYPQSSFGDRSLLLLGQAWNERHRPVEARGLFDQFMRRFPASSRMPELYLAVAHTYVEEQNWDAALQQYEEALTKFPASPARPRAEFYRALVYDKAGLVTNALISFTNFVAQFPANELAPRAQNWVADFYFNQKNFFQAQKEYQRIFENTNWPISHLTFQARLMAGRAAFGLLNYDAALNHFRALINLASSPTNLVAEALFALGDTTTRQPGIDLQKTLDNYSEAITAFRKVIQVDPTNELAVLAWGRIGDCYFQLAAQEPAGFQNATNATNAYAQVVLSRTAAVGARSQAEVGWGNVLERMAEKTTGPDSTALLTSALDHYLNVVYEKNLLPGEKLNSFWFKEATLAAARLAEANRQWDQAINLYLRVMEVLPATKPVCEKKIASARQQKSAEKN